MDAGGAAADPKAEQTSLGEAELAAAKSPHSEYQLPTCKMEHDTNSLKLLGEVRET